MTHMTKEYHYEKKKKKKVELMPCCEILMQQVYHLFSIPQFILKNLKRSFNRFKINDFKVALTTLKENLSCVQHDL